MTSDHRSMLRQTVTTTLKYCLVLPVTMHAACLTCMCTQYMYVHAEDLCSLAATPKPWAGVTLDTTTVHKDDLCISVS